MSDKIWLRWAVFTFELSRDRNGDDGVLEGVQLSQVLDERSIELYEVHSVIET
jgi:hypothetical protein